MTRPIAICLSALLLALLASGCEPKAPSEFASPEPPTLAVEDNEESEAEEEQIEENAARSFDEQDRFATESEALADAIPLGDDSDELGAEEELDPVDELDPVGGLNPVGQIEPSAELYGGEDALDTEDPYLVDEEDDEDSVE